MNEPKKHRTSAIRIWSGIVALLIIAHASPSGNGRKFYDDDPLAREPESQNASAVAAWDINLFYDLAENLFGRPGDPGPAPHAGDANTIDEVPDSSWFTNRILARPVSVDEASRGPLTGTGPAPGPWSVVQEKRAGFAPGLTMRDAKGDLWFVSFDANGFPEAATGAILVANKIFWTLGYWQVESFLVHVQTDQLVVAKSAMVRPQSGKERPMRMSDLEDVLKRSHRSADGSYRAIAARAVPGRPLGGFKYYGTRPDDPNDVVPHEHRRELRALKVFGAWTNLTDMKAGNTLDTLITTADGRGAVRHYLQDVGSTFGTGANAPHDYDEGWEALFEGDQAFKRLFTLGFYIQPWQTAAYVKNDSIGRFEGDEFDPAGWMPRVPTAAFLRARADDTFWAARRVMAFSDDMIRAVVKTGQYSDPDAEALLASVLIQRRDKIGRAYLPAINPVVDVALSESGMLTFGNAAVAARVAPAPAGGYVMHWTGFDNDLGVPTGDLGTSTSMETGQSQAPAALPSTPGSYIKVEIRAVQPVNPSWGTPVSAYFRRAGGWKLVGLERIP